MADRLSTLSEGGVGVINSSGIFGIAGVFSLCLLGFLVYPPAVLLAIACYWFLSGSKDRYARLLFIVAGASYLGLVNATKVPDSDLVLYLDWFSVARTVSFGDFMQFYAKEPLYYVAVYLLANSPFSSEQLYLFSSTVVIYSMLLVGFSRLCVFAGVKPYQINCIIVTIMFFPPLFSLSAHLMRQIMAGVLIFLFYVDVVVAGKKKWWLIAAATLIHYSAVVFLLFAFVKKIPRLHPLVGVAVYVCLLPISYFSALSLAPVLSQLPYIGTVFVRIALEESHFLGDLNVIAILFVVSTTLASLVALLKISSGYNKELIDRVWAVYPGIILLGSLVLAANSIGGRSEIAVRFYFYDYSLIWLAAPFIVVSAPRLGLFIPVVAVLSVVLFFSGLESSVWVYAPLGKLLTSSSWELWQYYRY